MARKSAVEKQRIHAPAPRVDDANIDFTGLIRLRTDVQDLQKILQRVGTGQTSLATNASYIKKTANDISKIVASLKEEGDYADNICHLRNTWEQIQSNTLLIKPEDEFNAQKLTQELSSLDTQLKDIVFEIGFLTIPQRLSDWLKVARPGYYIPFHDVFEDEMPDYADRLKLLNYLSWAPEAVEGGLVDAETGLIYRYSVDKKERRISYLILTIAILVAIGAVIGAAYIPVNAWPLNPNNLSTLLIGWFAVVAGIIVHLGVSTSKRLQSRRSHPPVIAISDFPLLVNAKLGQALLKVLLTLVGFFGLIFAVGIENAKPFNAFLVGYSLDSFVDLFTAGIEQKAATQISDLKLQLGVTGKT